MSRAQSHAVLRALVAWTVALTACTPEHTVIEVDLPEDVSFIAVLELNEAGRIERGSPLRAHRAGEPLGIAASSEIDAVIVGYTNAQLEPYGIVGPEIETGPLEEAVGCTPRLPTPRWTGLWTTENRLSPATEPGPRATAAFLSGRCPDVRELTIDIDRRCSSERCVPVVEPSGQCQLQLDLSGCGLGPAVATIDALGEACVEWGTNARHCEPQSPEPPAFDRVRCEGAPSCDYDLYLRPKVPRPFYTTKRARLFDAELYVHTALKFDVLPIPRARMRYSGYAFDLLVLGDRALVIATTDDRPQQECTLYLPRRLLSFDVETLELVETTTVPQCLAQLEPDPEGTGFLGVVRVVGRWHLGRFERNGRLLQSQLVDDRVEARLEDPPILSFETFEPTQVAVLEDRRHVAVLFAHRSEMTTEPLRAVVTIHEIETLRPVARHDLGINENPRTMALQGDSLALPIPFSRRVLWMDALSGVRTLELPVGEESFALSDFGGIWSNPATDHLLVGLTGGERAMLSSTARSPFDRMVAYDRDVDPIDALPWPPDPALTLGSGLSLNPGGDWVGLVTLSDPRTRRYLPMTTELGPGIVSHLRPDGRGRVFALLPWVPELVRLDFE